MTKTRILVVDDELSIIKFLRATLKAENYEVLTAVAGALFRLRHFGKITS